MADTAPARRREAPGRWSGTLPTLLRLRRATATGDAAVALRALAGDATTAAGFTLGRRRVLLVLTPDLARQLLVEHAASTVKGPALRRTRDLLGGGLLTAEGEDHHRARHLIAPAFTPRRIAAHTEVFTRLATEHVAGWTDGATLDLHREMSALTLDLVGRTLLGVDLRADTAGVRAELDAASARFADGGPALGVRRGRARRRGGARAGAGPAPDAIHAVVDRILRQRRAEPPGDRGDVVSALLAAGTEPGGLSAAELHDHVVTLMLAGHETTANALTWAFHLLGEHPDVERRLHDELRGPGGPGYARAVIGETMRLYPPAWIIGRELTADLRLGTWDARAGTVVAVSPLLLHHDPRWFPDPERFDPDRWLDGRRTAVPRHAYLPFGVGPRSCLGEQFAWAEAVAVLSAVATGWTARARPGHAVRARYGVTLRPAGGLPMTVRARPVAGTMDVGEVPPRAACGDRDSEAASHGRRPGSPSPATPPVQIP